MNRFLIIFFLLVVFKTEAQTPVLKRGDSLYATGNYSKAIEQYKAFDQPSEVFENIAKCYIALGNYDEAISNYNKALESHPENVLLKFDTAKLLASMKKYKDASVLLDQLVTNDANNLNYQYELGDNS